MGEIDAADKFSEIGLKSIFLKSEGYDYSSLISNARRIDFLYNTGNTILKQYKDKFIYAVSKGCEVRFLISSPESPLVTDTSEKMESIRAGLCTNTNIKEGISSSKEFIRDITDKENVRYMKCIPTCGILIIDDICIFTPYLMYHHSGPFSFVFEKDSSEYFKILEGVFDRTWRVAVKCEE